MTEPAEPAAPAPPAPPAPDLDKLLERLGELPPLPAVALKALALIRDPNSTMNQLAEVLSLDQAMAGLVLRWANSAYFGLRSKVTTVHQAVVYLGQNAIQSMVLAASMAVFINQPAPGYELERGDLWKHSVGVASAARLLTLKFGRHLAEDAYHAGLLADIGKLAFEALLRDVDTSTPEWQDRSFAELEQAHFGVDHATLGAEIARRWNLPAPLVEAIAYHHRPAEIKDGDGALLAAAVHVADAAVMMLGIGLGRDGLQYPLDPTACERLKLEEAAFYELAGQVWPLIQESETFLQMEH